jgi:hypothetical protein
MLFPVFKLRSRLQPDDTYRTIPPFAGQRIASARKQGFTFLVVRAACLYRERST